MLENKDILAALFRTTSDAIVFTDTERRLVMVNRAVAKMFGFGPKEILGKKTSVLYASPEDYERQGRERYNLSAEERAKPYEVTYQRKTGELFVGETVGCIVKDAAGEIFGFGGIIRDVSERKQREQELNIAYREIEDLKNRLQAENAYLQEEIRTAHGFREIKRESEAFERVLHKVEQVAPTPSTVLVLGESGTGKELIARAVHDKSDRRDRPLVKVSCAVLPANLIESELFGHEKGAFTGATSRRVGKFELADKGTIFLDEIGELPVELQPKLLRILQEGELERLGGAQTQRVDVRVIAATNRDLETMVEAGKFREDLFYRLNVFPIWVPPLRERKEDISILARHFVQRFGAKFGKKVDRIPAKVMDVLAASDWPGNVRELGNVIERAMILTTGDALQLEGALPAGGGPSDRPGSRSLKEMERSLIERALEETSWVIEGPRGAAQRLEIPPSTLRARIKKYRFENPLS